MNSDEADDLLEGIYQPEVEPTLVYETSKKQFAPWHKPRKHYVRIHQWCSRIQELIKSLKYKEGDVLSYLGMPGEDLLDIRTLHQTCQRAKVRLKYIGFDSTMKPPAGKGELLLSEHEVSSLEFIDQSSRVVKDRIERVAVASTMAGQTAEKHGPFDVINIDLCDSIAAGPHNARANYFDAILKLCTIQMQRTKPWLLFLTTRASRDQIHADTKVKLLDCVLANADGSIEFRDSIQSQLGIAVDSVRAERDGADQFAASTLFKAFCLGVGKWLLQLMMSAVPKAEVSMLQSYSYSVAGGENGPDMVSLAFRFAPAIEQPTDRTGLSTVTAFSSATPARSEAELAKLLIPAIRDIEDVDQTLAKNQAVRNKTIEQSRAILSQARYDPDAYDEFLRGSDAWGGRKFDPATE